jgi:alginate O-acetyltransferase complex protein AlgI
MLFVQFRFFVFFLIVFAVHWALRTNTSRKLWLLVTSHFFFACFFLGGVNNPSPDEFPAWTFYHRLTTGQPLPQGWWFPLVMWATTTLDYFVGRKLDQIEDARARWRWLMLSVCTNLSVLGFFKYINFGVASAGAFLAWLGLPTSDWVLHIFLPTGISFYTFQSMSYPIDIYRRRLPPIKSLQDYSFYVAFFPQLVAGPIVRAGTFLPQVFEKRVWANVNVRACMALFFIGFVKKACISDNVATVSDAYFASPSQYNLYSSFIGILYYAVQVYCDFSGYTDMAIASARLLNYELTPNFNFPYFATSITDFWRRWHISLGTWLRDYLYISLGGNRGTALFAFRNLMLTMLLGGLWHGASWNFVIWGGLNGLALAFHRYWQTLTAEWGAGFKRVMSWLAVPITFYVFLITLVFVRAQNVYHEGTGKLILSGTRAAADTLKAICLFNASGKSSFTIHCLWLFVVIAVIHYANYRGWFATWWQRIPYWLFAALLGIGFAAALVFVPAQFKPFIYFQF